MGRNFEEENLITIIITTTAAVTIMTIPIANETTVSAAITRILMIDKVMILGREEDRFLANNTMPKTLARVVHLLNLRNDPA